MSKKLPVKGKIGVRELRDQFKQVGNAVHIAKPISFHVARSKQQTGIQYRLLLVSRNHDAGGAFDILVDERYISQQEYEQKRALLLKKMAQLAGAPA